MSDYLLGMITGFFIGAFVGMKLVSWLYNREDKE
jgi:hypothetical protein